MLPNYYLLSMGPAQVCAGWHSLTPLKETDFLYPSNYHLMGPWARSVSMRHLTRNTLPLATKYNISVELHCCCFPLDHHSNVQQAYKTGRLVSLMTLTFLKMTLFPFVAKENTKKCQDKIYLFQWWILALHTSSEEAHFDISSGMDKTSASDVRLKIRKEVHSQVNNLWNPDTVGQSSKEN